MKDKIHIIVTGEEGQVKALAFSTFKIKMWLGVACAFVMMLFIMSLVAISFSLENMDLRFRLSDLQRDLHNAKLRNSGLRASVNTLDQENRTLVENALDELRVRSDLMESILSAVGLGIEAEAETKEQGGGSGGPFTRPAPQSFGDVIFRADRCLDRIKPVPLGFPVSGIITSKYGKRTDPINGKLAFHEGVDLKNSTGTKIRTTAEGVVCTRGRDRNYGLYVIIDHGNGFKTLYAHMKKILVKAGQHVDRGQVVGLLGNTGRSTGPHLHYEIRYDNRHVNPMKFMNIARHISIQPKALQEESASTGR